MDKSGLRGRFILVSILSLLFSMGVAHAVLLDLELYPHYFLADGEFDAIIVIGENASIQDSIGASDLVVSFQKYIIDLEAERRLELEELRRQLEQEAEARTSRIGGSGDLFEIGEFLGDVEESLSEGDSDRLLASGSIRTRRGITDYHQFIRFRDSSGEVVSGKLVFDEDDNDVVADFLFFEEDDVMFEYHIDFGSGLRSEIDDNELEDLEGEQFSMLGKTVTISSAKITSGGDIRFNMLLGETNDLLEEGSAQTYTIDDKEYYVEVLIISDNANQGRGAVKFRVNGEVTDVMAEGDVEFLDGGNIVLGVRSILPNEAREIGRRDILQPEDIDYDTFENLSTQEIERLLREPPRLIGGGDLVEFFIGSDFLEFEDKYTDNKFEKGVEFNNDQLRSAEVKIKGVRNEDEFNLYSITYRARARGDEGDIFLAAGTGLRSALREPGLMLTRGWDLVYNGLDEVGVSEIRFDARRGSRYILGFTNRRQMYYELPLVDSSVGLRMGDDDSQLYFIECSADDDFCVKEDSYLVMTHDNDDRGITNIVEYNSIDTSNKQVFFRDLNGDQKTVKYSGIEGVDAVGDLIVGGNTYKVFVGPGSDHNDLAVDLTNDGNVDGSEAKVVTEGGAIIDLGDSNNPGSDFDITITTVKKNFDGSGPLDSGTDEVITLTILDKGGDIGMELPSQTFLDLTKEERGNKKGMTPYGALYEFDDNSDPEELTIEYPLEQRGGVVEIVTGGEELGEVKDFAGYKGLQVGTTQMDSDVLDIDKQNMIVIGGPCSNRIAAELLGNLEPCTLGFEKGKGIIRLFQTNGHVALLVAGHEPQDTKEAMTVLLNYETYDLFKGPYLEVSGSGTTKSLRMKLPREWDAIVEEYRERLIEKLVENLTAEKEKMEENETGVTVEELNVTENVTLIKLEDIKLEEELNKTESIFPVIQITVSKDQLRTMGLLILFALAVGVSFWSGSKKAKEKQTREHPTHHPRKHTVKRVEKPKEKEEQKSPGFFERKRLDREHKEKHKEKEEQHHARKEKKHAKKKQSQQEDHEHHRVKHDFESALSDLKLKDKE